MLETFLLTTLSLRRERSRFAVAPLLNGLSALEAVFLPMLDLKGESTVEKVDRFVRSLRCLQDWIVGSFGMPVLPGEIDSDCGTLWACLRAGIISEEEWVFL